MKRQPDQVQLNTITCRQVSDQMTAYLKQALPVTQQQAINNHLLTCDACALALQEARVLEAELWAGAAALARRPTLSPEASLRIQEAVYRRMRRSLFLQRTRSLVQMTGSLAVAIVLLAGALVVGSQWLQYLATPEPVTGEQFISAPTAAASVMSQTDPASTAADTVYLQRTPIPIVPSPRLPAPTLVSVTPGEQPEAIAHAIVTAAIEGDSSRLSSLFSAMRTSQAPTLRLWSRLLGRCQGKISASDLRYESLPQRSHLIARVDMYHDGRFIGELKMRRINGEWFAVFASYPALSACRR